MSAETLTLEYVNDSLGIVVGILGSWSLIITIALGLAWDRIKRHEQEHKP